ncbi:hypothetical protein GCM10010430_42780 [Kitasatospora cystarginea]|uniref:Uncharacterized protein n=1 Tax=Kitasatospora cystarginea TaxID=58350 RepID=A0ABN3EC57_9ACTN
MALGTGQLAQARSGGLGGGVGVGGDDRLRSCIHIAEDRQDSAYARRQFAQAMPICYPADLKRQATGGIRDLGLSEPLSPESPEKGAPGAPGGRTRTLSVRCGAVRCGAVRCGAVRCGAVRCGAVRCGAVRRPGRLTPRP